MTVSSVVVVGVMVALSAVAAYGLLVQIPRAMVSADRYRLWALRDRVINDIINEVIAPSPAAWQLIRDIESRIRSAKKFTLIRLVAIAPVAVRTELPESLRDLPAPHDDARVIGQYKQELTVLTARAVRTNSVPGLALTVIITTLRALGIEPFRHLKRRVKDAEKRAVREPKYTGADPNPPLAALC